MEDREPELGYLGNVTHGAIDDQAGDTARHRRLGEEASPVPSFP
jgi:hypothetical protein